MVFAVYLNDVQYYLLASLVAVSLLIALAVFILFSLHQEELLLFKALHYMLAPMLLVGQRDRLSFLDIIVLTSCSSANPSIPT